VVEHPSSGPKPASESESILVRWMGPGDANAAGFVHGGVVMRLCDEAAGIAAIRHCGLRIVTAAVDRMTFVSPIHIAELVTCRAKVNAAWNTSMEVGVRVEAENPRSGEVRHTSTAYLTMVAVDEEGRPTAVPALLAESEDEIRRQREAELRRTNRLAERDQIIGERGRG
jgi:acyl-CoA hydrolase